MPVCAKVKISTLGSQNKERDHSKQRKDHSKRREDNVQQERRRQREQGVRMTLQGVSAGSGLSSLLLGAIFYSLFFVVPLVWELLNGIRSC